MNPDSTIRDLAAMNRHQKVIAEGLRFPEGPVLLSDGGVLVCELGGARLTKIASDGARTTIAETKSSPNGAAMGPDGRCYVCDSGGYSWFERDGLLMPGPPKEESHGSIQVVDISTGDVQTLYDNCNGLPLRGPNDIVFDEEGGFWFTDHGKFQKRSRDRGSVFYAKTDGSSIVECVAGLEGPNGIGLSTDGSRLYVSETLTARLWVYDLAAPGKLARNPTTFDGRKGTLLFGMGGYNLFDSLALDADGNICVACLPLGICVVSPEGKLLEILKVPDEFVTNICFGGAHHSTAYITLSATGRLLQVDNFRSGLAVHFECGSSTPRMSARS